MRSVSVNIVVVVVVVAAAAVVAGAAIADQYFLSGKELIAY
jgi:hypothetical protein